MSATKSRTPTRAPRLASDALRGWVSVGASLVPQLVFMAWAGRSPNRESEAAWVVAFTATMIVFYLIYLVLTWWAFARLGPEELRRVIAASTSTGKRARIHELTAMDVSSWVLAAVGTALVVVAYTLAEPTTRKAPLALILAGVMVVLAWAVMHISATVLLLRLDVREPTVQFPDEGPHGIHDYGYVATQLLATFATSDVTVISSAGRRAVSRLSIAAMVFNTIVVALLVSAFLGLTS